MNEFVPRESFIRNRINENLLKVNNESRYIKRLLNTSVQTSKSHKDKYGQDFRHSLFHDLNLYATYTSREDLLRTCIILATSRNTVAQENLMDVIKLKLGRIKEKDYIYIAKLIYLKDTKTVEHVNDYLSFYLEGFEDCHKKLYKKFYGI